MKAPIFVINPVKSYGQAGQQMLILKVTNESWEIVVITICELSLRFHL